jgi:hypothetical protein
VNSVHAVAASVCCAASCCNAILSHSYTLTSSACSTWWGAPIALAGVQLLLPQPEFDYFATAARAASAFVVEIQGKLNMP